MFIVTCSHLENHIIPSKRLTMRYITKEIDEIIKII